MASVERNELPSLVDIDEVAAHLGVTVRHVRRLVAERRIPYLKWGHLLRFDPVEVGVWLRAAHVEPVPEPRATVAGIGMRSGQTRGSE